jgi:nicotinamidase-related amidase
MLGLNPQDLEELLDRLHSPLPPVSIRRDETALLLVDMQKLAGVEYVAQEAVAKGIPKDTALRTLRDMDGRIKAATKNAGRVLEAFRRSNLPIFHVKIESRFPSCSDVSPIHRRVGFFVEPGSHWGEFFDEVSPGPGEVVLTKTCSGAFVGTDLDRILRNVGIRTLIIVGFYTDQCVETAARDAADIGYDVILVRDACATYTRQAHENTLRAIGDVYVKLETTDFIVREIEALPVAKPRAEPAEPVVKVMAE